MFCTNCGEEMRDTDKFCAACGTAAAPRPNKKRVREEEAQTVAPPAQEPAPVPRSTAEAFRFPQQASTTGAGEGLPREIRAPERLAETQTTPPGPSDPTRTATDDEEKQQVLLQAEEIASTRGMMPVEVLPDLLPFPKQTAAPRIAGTRTCPSCGKLNPDATAFCESCGRKLTASATPEVTSPVNESAGWLYNQNPAPAPATTPARAPASSAVTVAPAQPAHSQPNQGFSYYYDDHAGQAGNRTLLFVLLGVLALGIIGVFYLMLRPSAKSTPAANVVVKVSPTQAQVAPGNAFDFAATVTGSGDTDVNWSVQEGSAGGKLVNRGAQATGGQVATMAVYIAPSTPGTYHIVAASKANPSKTATAEITVAPK
jgi:hypothetical protein